MLTLFKNVHKTSLSCIFARKASTEFRRLVLGIETSCDDTCAAVVDCAGHVLGDAHHSQTSVSVAAGGVHPVHSSCIHKQYINEVVQTALARAHVLPKGLDAVAVTVKPGMPLSLEVGLEYAKQLAKREGLPLIPIHHMEAHALTIRMIQEVQFPFLVCLVSGGHCLLAVARDVSDFLLLGTATDGSPGEAYDKVARRLKLKTLPQCEGLSGGAMIELMAKGGDPDKFFTPNVMPHVKSCNFSFAGLKSTYLNYIEEAEKQQGVVASHVISNVSDLCASFQYAILKHLARPLQRALTFCEMKGLLSADSKMVVLSGGVACNSYLRDGLQKVCETHNCQLISPPPHLCTDNGIMIAWNGVEKLLLHQDLTHDHDSVVYSPKSPLGEDWTGEVTNCLIKTPKLPF